jgi:predicted methyltransferase
MSLTRLVAVAAATAIACGGAPPPQNPNPPKSADVDLGPAPADGNARLDWAIAGAQRSARNRARDGFRHPKETLAFFGVTKDSHVVELWPGRGWYTEILAPFLRDSGKLTVTNFDPKSAQGERKEMAAGYDQMLAAAPGVYGKVTVARVNPPGDIVLGPDGSADVVLTFRNFHNWIMGGFAQNVVAAAFKVLKPGGVFGVVEHRASPGTDAKKAADTGYVPEQAIIDMAQAAGFKLAGKSEINANPKDDHDHPGGVWALPPSLRNGDKDKAKYLAIGESDRMTLKFVK